MGKPLSERIASARSTDRINIGDLAQLVADATVERDRLSAAAVKAAADSVDFGLPDADRDDAAALADRYTRTATGLATVIVELTAKLEAKRNSAAQQAKAAERAEIVAERDALAERLRTEWPEIEARVVELLSAIKSNNDRLTAARMPDLGAEAVVRGAGALLGRDGMRSLLDMRLPALSDPRAFAWPVPDQRADPGGMEEIRRMRIADRQRRDAENGQWSKYLVTPPGGSRRDWQPIRHRMGEGRPDRAGTIELTVELADEARSKGYTVELANGRTIGAPAGAATF